MKYVNIQTGQVRDFELYQPIPEEYQKMTKTAGMEGKHHSAKAKALIGQKNREKMKGKHWYNNGKDNILAFDCPTGYVAGRLK
jgi:hypothetical protein